MHYMYIIVTFAGNGGDPLYHSREERKLFIKKKYMDLAFVPEFGDERSTQL